MVVVVIGIEAEEETIGILLLTHHDLIITVAMTRRTLQVERVAIITVKIRKVGMEDDIEYMIAVINVYFHNRASFLLLPPTLHVHVYIIYKYIHIAETEIGQVI